MVSISYAGTAPPCSIAELGYEDGLEDRLQCTDWQSRIIKIILATVYRMAQYNASIQSVLRMLNGRKSMMMTQCNKHNIHRRSRVSHNSWITGTSPITLTKTIYKQNASF